MRPDELQSARELIQIALMEDLDDGQDVTTQALISPAAHAEVQIVSRQAGVLAGAPLASLVFDRLDPEVVCRLELADGAPLAPGAVIARLRGPLRALLTGERTVLNFLTLLSGTATLTRRYVDAVAGTGAEILDTRKTLPGLRLLQKYAVRCGGGVSHRSGLYDAVLAKDNHLAWLAREGASLADAVRQARAQAPGVCIEFEVDSLRQLEDILPGAPDIVLLDNFPLADLEAAVQLRNRLAPGVLLEASGGVTLQSVVHIAARGVERISVGALTHSAPALDIGFDWSAEL